MPDEPAPLTLYLVRHGRTRFNEERRIQGWSDSELTPGGLDGVRSTARHLSDRTFHAAYASPSGRTLATAREILAHHPGVPVAPLDGLRELNFGDLEEAHDHEVGGAVDWPSLFAGVLDGTHPGLPGGESARAYQDRVLAAFGHIEERHGPGEHVLVVSHGMTLTIFLLLMGVRPAQILANASVTVLEVRADGSRHAPVVGFDPSGEAVTEVAPPLDESDAAPPGGTSGDDTAGARAQAVEVLAEASPVPDAPTSG